MELYPRDLGIDRYLSVLRRRLSPITAASPNRAPIEVPTEQETEKRSKRRSRRLTQFWIRGQELDAQDTEKVGALLWSSAPVTSSRVGIIVITIYLFMFGMIPAAMGAWNVVFMLTLAWAGLVALMLTTPRLAFRRANKNVLHVTEVENLMPFARGRLDEAYLNLVRDVLQARVPSASAQEDIRAALRALGETISQLPAERAPTEDAVDLAKRMNALRAQASQETDAMVRDSLLRQAATLEKRMGAADETAKLARRVQTLRREARVQMDALRAVLVGYDATASALALPGEMPALTSATQLAEAVQRAAREAQAASVARQELENEEIVSLLGKPVPSSQPAPQIQRLSAGGPAPAASPAPTPKPAQPQEQEPQPGQNRIWWRNAG